MATREGVLGNDSSSTTQGAGGPVDSAELDEALAACDFPLVVWELPQSVVRLANRAAGELTGWDPSELIGHRLVDLIDPREVVERVSEGFRSGVFDSVHGSREVVRSDGRTVPVVVWSRAFDLDTRRSVVSLIVPADQVGRLGRDPSAPWRDLSAVALGTADAAWRVQSVSADLRDVLGRDATSWIGSSITDLVHPDDLSSLTDPHRLEADAPGRGCRARFADARGRWIDVCFLSAPIGDAGDIAFAVIGTPAPWSGAPANRIAELELRLRHIGAEVRASGVLNQFETTPAPSEHPQLSELTSRQWEILGRILHGERVPSIAKALYLSPSTVRHHLTMIFRKFGVHSQPELIELLRRAPRPDKHSA